MDTIIYSKTLPWAYEREYRLAIVLGHGERDWNLIPYHPEEVSELRLGASATDEFTVEIAALAKARNPVIKIFSI